MKKFVEFLSISVLILIIAPFLTACDFQISPLSSDGQVTQNDVEEEADELPQPTPTPDPIIEEPSTPEPQPTVEQPTQPEKLQPIQGDETILSQLFGGKINYDADDLDFTPQFPTSGYIEVANCAEEVIRAGAFTQELRDKYINYPINPESALADLRLQVQCKNFSYQISFNEDWTIRIFYQSFWDDEKQLSHYFKPIENGEAGDYYLAITEFSEKSTPHAYIYVTYETGIENKTFLYYESIPYLSQVSISGGGARNEIFLLTGRIGAWDVEKVWEMYKDELLETPWDYDRNGRLVTVFH